MADSYNKHVTWGPGTLIENWYEEQILRNNTGWGRNFPIEHIPKTKEGPAYTRPRMGTELRVLGQGPYEKYISSNREYGRTLDPTLKLRKIGVREQALLDSMFQQITADLLASDQAKEAQRNQRYFDTTSKCTYNWKTADHPIGKRVMKTQDGHMAHSTDEAFLVEHGFRKPLARKARAELEAEVNSTPITLYPTAISL